MDEKCENILENNIFSYFNLIYFCCIYTASFEENTILVVNQLLRATGGISSFFLLFLSLLWAPVFFAETFWSFV